jgi:RimJ/RimL family protein N-acetyltransferase
VKCWQRYGFTFVPIFILKSKIEMPLRTYRIETARVILRCYAPSDAAAMSETILRNHEHLIRWMPWAVKDQHTVPFCTDLIRSFRGKYDLGMDYAMGVFDVRDGRYIGGTGVHPRVGEGALEIGYWMDERYAGQGFATHIAAALTKVCFEYEGMYRMNIHMQVGNIASERIPLRLGYQREGRLRQRIPLAAGGHADVYFFSMLREEYDASEIKAMPLKAYGFDGQLLATNETVQMAESAAE